VDTHLPYGIGKLTLCKVIHGSRCTSRNFVSVAQQPNWGLGCLILGFLDHTKLDTHITQRQHSSEPVIPPGAEAA
jgi:hypothetical protein